MKPFECKVVKPNLDAFVRRYQRVPPTYTIPASDGATLVSSLYAQTQAVRDFGEYRTGDDIRCTDPDGSDIGSNSLNDFQCYVGYDDGQSVKERRGKISLKAPNGQVAVSVLSAMMNSDALDFQLNYARCIDGLGIVTHSSKLLRFSCRLGREHPPQGLYFPKDDDALSLAATDALSARTIVEGMIRTGAIAARGNTTALCRNATASWDDIDSRANKITRADQKAAKAHSLVAH
jgi:hypothetical protein